MTASKPSPNHVRLRGTDVRGQLIPLVVTGEPTDMFDLVSPTMPHGATMWLETRAGAIVRLATGRRGIAA